MSPFACIQSVKSFRNTVAFHYSISICFTILAAYVFTWCGRNRNTQSNLVMRTKFVVDGNTYARRTYPMNMCFHVYMIYDIWYSSRLPPARKNYRTFDTVTCTKRRSNRFRAIYEQYDRLLLDSHQVWIGTVTLNWNKVIWWWHLTDFKFHEQ